MGDHTSGIEIIGANPSFKVAINKIYDEDDVQIYQLILTSTTDSELQPMTLRWRIPAHNVKGVWTTNALHEKRLRADWETPSVESRGSVDAPVLCLFSHEDDNVQTFACADAINTLQLAAPIHEEDNLIYCQLKLFTEKMPLCTHYETTIRIDNREIHFSEALSGVGDWWADFEELKPMQTFEAGKLPLYSTWYAYHQSVSEEALLEECRQSAELGYKLIIVDDGWQTTDNSRGYDFTGDWEPERLSDMAGFVKDVHALDMKCILWYSVPFCGVKSKAYQKFKGKFLTENHRWAPVFDPRYPEVREYLINIYTAALKYWNLDGFKLDFIDDFKAYPETEMSMADGRDYSSVNEAVDRLLMDVSNALVAIKPDILIEFRQKYIGPAMRKYGNMFRAFDCPNDSLTNRLRTTDVKLLCGTTSVHSDMLTWHAEEPVELAALQFVNILFSVPQLSVRLNDIPQEYKNMINFYTSYWLANRSILLDGTFIPFAPLSNYPILSASLDDKIIYGVYDNMIVEIDEGFTEIDMINGKINEQIVFELFEPWGACDVRIFNCQGDLDWQATEEFGEGVHSLEVPTSGMICLARKINN